MRSLRADSGGPDTRGGGQFFFTKAATLLVFAGIWALMRGILDIVTAFQVTSLAP